MEQKWNRLEAGIRWVNELVWSEWLLVLLLGSGIYLMLCLRFLPLKNLGFALKCVLGKEDPGKNRKEENKGQVSSLAALTTELAATMGTGNIVGVSTAMVLGGPGALFWMVLTSIMGMATKLVESTLSVKYRTRNLRGEMVGGPMYTLENGFPCKRAGRLLGMLYALFAVGASFGMGNMTQANSIADAMYQTFRIPKEVTGLVMLLLTLLVVLGGIQRIAGMTQRMIPFLGVVYLLGTLCVIFDHREAVFPAIAGIFTAAFSPQAVSGGMFGTILATAGQSLRWGVSRGIFSNEAGLGAAGISAAAARTEDYVRQGYISMTGVFFDTIVMCPLTGLAIAASGVLGMTDKSGNPLTGTELTLRAFGTTLGSLGEIFVSVSIALFAFATIAGWAYQGERAFEFLQRGKKQQGSRLYRIGYGLAAFAGCVCSLEMVWNLSDICNACMAVPNLICVFALSQEICREIREYRG